MSFGTRTRLANRTAAPVLSARSGYGPQMCTPFLITAHSVKDFRSMLLLTRRIVWRRVFIFFRKLALSNGRRHRRAYLNALLYQREHAKSGRGSEAAPRYRFYVHVKWSCVRAARPSRSYTHRNGVLEQMPL